MYFLARLSSPVQSKSVSWRGRALPKPDTCHKREGAIQQAEFSGNPIAINSPGLVLAIALPLILVISLELIPK